MKDLFIRDVPIEGTATFFAAVKSKETKQTKKEKDYVAVILSDKTGQMDAKIWDDVEELSKLFDVGDVVKVQGQMSSYRDKPQIAIKKLRKAEESEIDIGDYLPRTEMDPEDLYDSVHGELNTQATLGSEAAGLALAIISSDEVKPRLLRAPAAMKLHHAKVGGLLEHICNLMQITNQIHLPNTMFSPSYAFDRGLVMAACALHDIGKCWELEIKLTFSYSTVGNLVGHVAMGLMLVEEYAKKLGTSENEKMKLLHIIASHHGKLEHGALKVPATKEAILFHCLDELDAKLAIFDDNVAQSTTDEDFTNYVPALETYLYKR